MCTLELSFFLEIIMLRRSDGFVESITQGQETELLNMMEA